MGHYLKLYSCKENYINGAACDDDATSEVISVLITVNCFADLLLE